MGPKRIMPGKLSVSRAFGDITAKDKAFGGNRKVLIAKPDVFLVDVAPDMDFVLLACIYCYLMY